MGSCFKKKKLEIVPVIVEEPESESESSEKDQTIYVDYDALIPLPSKKPDFTAFDTMKFMDDWVVPRGIDFHRLSYYYDDTTIAPKAVKRQD